MLYEVITVNINSLGDKESRDNYREALVNHFAVITSYSIHYTKLYERR